jgi:hypothetical protein
MLGILQALPNTALWTRLQEENRLIENMSNTAMGDQNALMNFIPTRAIAEIAKEYVEGFWMLYEPTTYLHRCFQQCLNINVKTGWQQTKKLPLNVGLRVISNLIWHQGICRREIRGQFWQQLGTILWKKPQVLVMYLVLCLTGEHFWEYRILAKERIALQLGYDPLSILKVTL